jgi:hypothetical protein
MQYAALDIGDIKFCRIHGHRHEVVEGGDYVIGDRPAGGVTDALRDVQPGCRPSIRAH